MAIDITPADPTIVLELMAAYRRSKVMFAAVDLGIFDVLEAGHRTATDVATQLQCDESAMMRLLHALVGLGLVEEREGMFGNSDVAHTYLTRSSPQRFTGYIQYSNDVGWGLWGNLEDAIREGTHRWKQTFGMDGAIFSNFFATEDAKREFLMGMNGFGVLSSPFVVEAFDLSPFQTLVDLGTASGHLVLAACERYPTLQAVALDLAEALPLAKELIEQSPFADRIQTQAADFFVDPLPAGDLYALGRILHDWSLVKIQFLLKKIFEALPEGGGLLIAEKILWENHRGPSWAQMQDLNMLLCTEGRERTLSEYDDLLKAAGFRKVIGKRTQAPIDAILAIK